MYLFPEEKYLSAIIPVIPDFIELVDMINDIMSFYKESVVGTEKNTYFMNTARMRGCSPVEVLEETCNRMAGLTKDATQSFDKFRDLQKVFIDFMDGQSSYPLGVT